MQLARIEQPDKKGFRSQRDFMLADTVASGKKLDPSAHASSLGSLKHGEEVETVVSPATAARPTRSATAAIRKVSQAMGNTCGDNC